LDKVLKKIPVLPEKRRRIHCPRVWLNRSGYDTTLPSGIPATSIIVHKTNPTREKGMAPPDDVSDVLAEELMTEMAGSFFGDRRRMERRMAVLDDLAGQLKARAGEVDDQARLFHRVATTPEKGRELLNRLSVEAAAFPAEAGVPRRALPERTPAAFTPKGAYVKLMETAYHRLQTAAAAYMGESAAEPGDGDAGPTYRLIEAIVRLLNEEIAHLNQNRSPSQVLRAAKRFRTWDPSREAVTGGGGNFADGFGLDKDMAFPSIRIENFGLRTFPPLPALESQRPVVSRFAADIYDRRREMALSALRTVRQAIRAARREKQE
jgi:hypothetical protein